SLYLPSGRTHRLNTKPGLAAVWASAKPLFDGAVSSATTFQTLPSPLPVLSVTQPAGTLPRSPLLNRIARVFSAPATRVAAISSPATDITKLRITDPPHVRTRNHPAADPVPFESSPQRQSYGADRPLARLAFQLDPAAVSLDDALGDAQAQPGTALGSA